MFDLLEATLEGLVVACVFVQVVNAIVAGDEDPLGANCH